MTSKVCRQCSADVSLLQLDHIEGEEGGIHVTVEGLPALNCVNGHRRFTTPEFPLELIQRLLDSEALEGITPAVRKGLFRKRLHCPECGAELSDVAESSIRNRASIEIPDGPAVTVALHVPLHRCSDCSMQASQPKSGLDRNIMQAMANAFRSADITPG
jgi:transposase